MRAISTTSSVRPCFERLEGRRLFSAGTLDPNFNNGAPVLVSNGGSSEIARAMAFQPDGKYVVVGQDTQEGAIIARFSDGLTDSSFGPEQIGSAIFYFGKNLTAQAVAVQPNGKIVFAGGFSKGSGENTQFQSFVGCLLPNGTLDPSFNKGLGYIKLTFNSGNSGIYAMALQKDGKIVVAGRSYMQGDDDIAMARLNSNGSVDKSFGKNGYTYIDQGNDELATAVAIDYNGSAASNSDYGKIVAAGVSTRTDGSASSFSVARLNKNGKLDSSFAGDGRLIAKVPGHKYSSATSVVIQPGGKIVIGGTTGSQMISFHDDVPGSGDDLALARLQANGAVDKTFGTAHTGFVDTHLGVESVGNALVSDYRQNLVLGGTSGGNFALAAYSSDGVLDTGFGTAGIVNTSLSPATSQINALALGPNRTLMAAGTGTELSRSRFDLARYIDVLPNVSISALNSVGYEKGESPANIIVNRHVVLPYATRVYLGISGTAKPTTDYTGINIYTPVLTQNPRGGSTSSGGGTAHPALLPPTHPGKIGYIDIPAGQMYAIASVIPVDHDMPSGNKSAIFSLNSNSDYNVEAPSTANVTIVGDGNTGTLNVENDAYVQDGDQTNINFGTDPTLEVKNSGTTGKNRQAYLRFDLTGITSINSAKIRLMGNLNNTSSTNVVTNVYSVAGGWAEAGITFSNKPAAGTTALGSATILDTTPRYYTLDVTAYVKAQLAAGHSKISFVLKNPSTSSAVVVFDSRDAGAINGPMLVLG